MINLEITFKTAVALEVRFGAINGNAINIDKALSTTSTNPVENRIITNALNALQAEVNSIANQITKEVVQVESYEELVATENPSTEVVYTITSTGDIYIFDGENFVDCTNKVVDNTIYTKSIDILMRMTLPAGRSYSVVVATGLKSESYTLVVSADRSRVLISKDGWANIKSNAWDWHRYSYEGHTHTTSEVDGLEEAIEDATANKQDKTDEGLQTTNKTIVGAINELCNMGNIVRAYTIDFQESRETVQMRNLNGAITITKIVADNVATLRVAINGTSQTIALTNGEWNGTLAVADGALMVWTIGRTTEGSIASINVKYQ